MSHPEEPTSTQKSVKRTVMIFIGMIVAMMILFAVACIVVFVLFHKSVENTWSGASEELGSGIEAPIDP